MSTSRSRGASALGPSAKKFSACVRPGVLEVRASALRLVSALMSEDLPTLERPAKAISGVAIGGSWARSVAAQRKSQAPAKSFLPESRKSFSSCAPAPCSSMAL